MGDWEFLYEMNERGYSADQIAEAASSGAAPWEWDYLLKSEWVDSELANEPKHSALHPTQIHSFKGLNGFIKDAHMHQAIFHDLISCAIRHFNNTGRYLQIWGELGEIFAEIHHGLLRHKTNTPGSDGIIDGKLVEIKTISPEKNKNDVYVKRDGNFQQLLIVRIDNNFQFQSRLLDRHLLERKGKKFLKTKF